MRKLDKQKGFTFIELIVVISILGILALIFMSRTAGKETATKLQATANEVMLLYKACQDWRMVTGSATFSGISLTDLQNKGLWGNKPTPLGGNYTIAVDATDSTKIRIDIPASNLSANQRTQFVNLLLSRGFTTVTDNTTFIRIIQ